MSEEREKHQAGQNLPERITMEFSRAEIELLLSVCYYCANSSTTFHGEWRRVEALIKRFEDIAKTWGGDKVEGDVSGLHQEN